MGNNKFRLSNMMPNSWFYKLRDMGRSTRAQSKILNNNARPTIPTSKGSNPSSKQANINPNRPSYYFPSSNYPCNPKAFDTHFPIDSPRKKETKKLSNTPSVSTTHHVRNPSSSASKDIIFDLNSLPPILTKPANGGSTRKDARLRRIKVRPSSPKINVKRVQAERSKKMVNCRRFSESLVVVKKSSDPERDFRESMVEMIVENDVRDSKELEELLVCYLSLNSEEHHDLIFEVFEEIWISLSKMM